MHVYMKQQLVEDRVAELWADAHRARHQRVRRAQRASEASQAMARREWRVDDVARGGNAWTVL